MLKAKGTKGGRRIRKGSDAHRTPSWVVSHPRASRLILAVLTAMTLAALRVEWSPLSGARGLSAHDIAAQDIRASQTVEVVDAALSEEKRTQARDSVTLVFEHDVLLARGVQEKIESAFSGTRDWFEAATTVAPTPIPTPDDGAEVVPAPDDDESTLDPGSPSRPTIDPGALQARLDQFESELGVECDETHLATLQMSGFSAAIQRDVAELVRTAMNDYVVQSRSELPNTGAVRVVRVEGSNSDEFALSDFSRVRDPGAARRFVSEEAERNFRDRPPHIRQALVHVAAQLVVPNLRFDASETEVRRQLAAESVQPVTTTYQKGQIIIRAGDQVTDWTLTVLDEMNAGARSYSPVRHLLAVTVLLALFLGLLERFSVRYISKFRRRFNDLLAMAALLLVVAATARLLRGVGVGLQDVVSSLPPSAFAYAVPVAVGGIIVRTLMNSETAFVWAVATAIVCADISGGSPWLGVYYLGSAMAAAGGVGHASERGRLVRAGFVAALANVALVLTLDVVTLTGLSGSGPAAADAITNGLFDILFALGGGMISGVLAVGLVPVLEPLGFVTDSRLLELSNLNHPLVRDMIVKAPGTYHHSMVVGSLAEAAAEAIHANSLLVRVGAYFHDVGKMLKPIYFIENQRDGENPHDRLTPHMSALVITNHVKEGIELGVQYGLPMPIIDMIPQHHGTSRVSFFFNKALQQADPDKGEVDETSFRYAGPKPQTKEAAIMMMADGVEAATRSLSSHTEGAIRARVSRIVNSVVSDGQLDECPLTLKDLHTVSETFIQVLLGIHHHRIEYPQAPNPADSKSRAVPASSLTLEVASLTPAPDAPHPLEMAAAERKAAAEQNKEPVEISTTGELSREALAEASKKSDD